MAIPAPATRIWPARNSSGCQIQCPERPKEVPSYARENVVTRGYHEEVLHSVQDAHVCNRSSLADKHGNSRPHNPSNGQPFTVFLCLILLGADGLFVRHLGHCCKRGSCRGCFVTLSFRFVPVFLCSVVGAD